MMYMHFCAEKFCKAGPDASVNRYRGTMYGAGYEDFVQNPLQPLQDNLESPTYEVFERDSTKYSLYEEAIYGALMDLVSEEEKDQRTVVLMVLGAGRGPIVDSAISAAKSAGRKVQFFAIEKNKKAVNTLYYKNRMEWEPKKKRRTSSCVNCSDHFKDVLTKGPKLQDNNNERFGSLLSQSWTVC